MSKRDFEKLLLEAVDEAFSSLEESLRQATYRQLEDNFNVYRQEIPYKIEAFAGAIEEIFRSNATDLEILILQRLYEKAGSIFQRNKFDESSFMEHVRRARGLLYEDLVSSMQGGLAIFHLENPGDLNSFRLIAVNSAATEVTRIPREKLLGKTAVETYPQILKEGVMKVLADVIRSGKAKNVGDLVSKVEGSQESRLSVMAFPLVGNCVGLVFKNVAETLQSVMALQKDEKQPEDVEANVGEWRWEPDTQWRKVYSTHSHSRERWIRKKITGEPRRADYLSVLGRECLRRGDLSRARKFFYDAEEAYRELNKLDEAFENASLKVNTYACEENANLREYFDVAEEYFHRYSDFSKHEHFAENLGYYRQWKGYQNLEEGKYESARAFFCEAETIFSMLKKKGNALFNAARRVFTYRIENSMDEYVKSAEEFFEKYKELSGNEEYKETHAYYFLFKADESRVATQQAEFLGAAEKLFLETNKRERAFEAACKRIDLYWLNASDEDEQSSKRCLEATEKFFEIYQDFSEREKFTKILAKYYLFQARALSSQLKTALH